ncbi:hypothetical protein HDV04_002181 [Boothiomyces sp. JEL0838]|nr:hypothetical protein HDV04_002181 [Boothiomyces sp. JEL0838]
MRYKCGLCNADAFEKPKELESHLHVHLPAKTAKDKLKCFKCGVVARTIKKCQDHEVSHFINAFCCNECGMKFTGVGSLVKHFHAAHHDIHAAITDQSVETKIMVNELNRNANVVNMVRKTLEGELTNEQLVSAIIHQPADGMSDAGYDYAQPPIFPSTPAISKPEKQVQPLSVPMKSTSTPQPVVQPQQTTPSIRASTPANINERERQGAVQPKQTPAAVRTITVTNINEREKQTQKSTSTETNPMMDRLSFYESVAHVNRAPEKKPSIEKQSEPVESKVVQPTISLEKTRQPIKQQNSMPIPQKRNQSYSTSPSTVDPRNGGQQRNLSNPTPQGNTFGPQSNISKPNPQINRFAQQRNISNSSPQTNTSVSRNVAPQTNTLNPNPQVNRFAQQRTTTSTAPNTVDSRNVGPQKSLSNSSQVSSLGIQRTPNTPVGPQRSLPNSTTPTNGAGTQKTTLNPAPQVNRFAPQRTPSNTPPSSITPQRSVPKSNAQMIKTGNQQQFLPSSNNTPPQDPNQPKGIVMPIQHNTPNRNVTPNQQNQQNIVRGNSVQQSATKRNDPNEGIKNAPTNSHQSRLVTPNSVESKTIQKPPQQYSLNTSPQVPVKQNAQLYPSSTPLGHRVEKPSTKKVGNVKRKNEEIEPNRKRQLRDDVSIFDDLDTRTIGPYTIADSVFTDGKSANSNDETLKPYDTEYTNVEYYEKLKQYDREYPSKYPVHRWPVFMKLVDADNGTVQAIVEKVLNWNTEGMLPIEYEL